MIQKTKNVNGFTIVEILVVIIVIGILATLVVVASNSYFRHAADSATQVSLEDASRKLDSYKLKNGEFDVAALKTYKSQEGVELTQESLSSSNYCLKAASTRYSDIVYYVNNKGEITTTNCASAAPPPSPPPPSPPPAPKKTCPVMRSPIGGTGPEHAVMAYPQSADKNSYTGAELCGSSGATVNLWVICKSGTTYQRDQFINDKNDFTGAKVFQKTVVLGGSYPNTVGYPYDYTYGTFSDPKYGEAWLKPQSSWGSAGDDAVVCQWFADEQGYGRMKGGFDDSHYSERFYFSNFSN